MPNNKKWARHTRAHSGYGTVGRFFGFFETGFLAVEGILKVATELSLMGLKSGAMLFKKPLEYPRSRPRRWMGKGLPHRKRS